ncbi:HNH endonuclease [Leptolyngbya sp. GB1-A1]|uniref:HNH endonuclease n=1 Tax=Leptolyngbya sp. GB1-A1 TaxID=2933908 RepID=UPI00329A7B5D
MTEVTASFSLNFALNSMDILQEAQKLSSTAHSIGQSALQSLKQTVKETQSAASEIASGLATSGGAIANSLQGLPQTAQELAQEMPKLAYRLQYRAGLRVGDSPRTAADVMQLFEKIPGTAKLEVSEMKIRQFLADKHGSHIRSRHNGGSNGADNILWEVGADNLRRGARNMTASEQLYIRFYNAVDSIAKNSGTIAKLGITATGTAVLTQAVVTAVAHILDLYRGDITLEEFRNRVLEAAVTAGIAAPIFFVVLIGVLAVFPELTLLLSAPAVVAGFNTLFGMSIAVPLIQSIVRHVEANGFGEETANAYRSLTGQL